MGQFNQLKTTDVGTVHWTGGFWGERFQKCEDVVLPSMFEALNTPENSAVFSNFYVAAGLQEGEHLGTFWSDGDCYKWMEAASHVFGITGNPELDAQLDELIDVIGQAQDEDGYISTQIQLTDKQRWEQLRYHELYNMGHLLTAASVHYRTTGKESFLNIAVKLADYLYTVFQPRPEHLAQFGFNPSNIMGCIDLYRATGEERYLELAGIFVDMRGSVPGGTDQNQAHVPLREETDAVGHAVTATYLWCGATDVYAETGEDTLLEALERIWTDMVSSKMYITGGVGPQHHGESIRWDSVHEAFHRDYHLHNASAYNETCANIGNAMWNWRLLQLTGDAKYGDLMEQILYNSRLSGMSLDGRLFCYTNPLRWHGEQQEMLSNDTPERWFIHSCYCCPPQVARTIARMQDWAYSLSNQGLWVHLYGSNHLQTQLPDGSEIELEQISGYPWDGQVTLNVLTAPDEPFAIKLRIPGWAKGAELSVNGVLTEPVQPGTYTSIQRAWSVGDTVSLTLPLQPRVMKSHPMVEESRNHVALMRGPVVYCLESADLPEDVALSDIYLPRDPAMVERAGSGSLAGLVLLEGEARRLAGDQKSLYQEAGTETADSMLLQLIPYFAWNNRGSTEMSVWLPLY
jgi:DUF1680 family protein